MAIEIPKDRKTSHSAAGDWQAPYLSRTPTTAPPLRSSGLLDHEHPDEGVEPAAWTLSSPIRGFSPPTMTQSPPRGNERCLEASWAVLAGIAKSGGVELLGCGRLGIPFLALLLPQVCLAFGQEAPGTPDKSAGAAVPCFWWYFHLAAVLDVLRKVVCQTDDIVNGVAIHGGRVPVGTR